jgi:hypothetical protein
MWARAGTSFSKAAGFEEDDEVVIDQKNQIARQANSYHGKIVRKGN